MASCLPEGATAVLLDVKANPGRRQLPVRVRLLGFSRLGRLALVEQREGEEIEGGLWIIRVVDLEANIQVVQEELETELKSTTSFCETHGERLRHILTAHEIVPTALPKLSQTPLKHDGERYALTLRPKAKRDEGVRPFEILLQSKRGTRNLGAIEQIYVESGRNPSGAPRILGVLKSPWESRLAVLVRQDLIATEAASVPLVHVFGTKLP